MPTESNEIGDFLRARRMLVRPERIGLPRGARRRVPGLRRDEVALLAGISSDYYARLERGRDRHPSQEVLDSLARVFDLDARARSHLRDLAMERPPDAEVAESAASVPAHLRDLIDALGVPAFIEGRWMDILAANDLATALSPRLAAGRNRLQSFFADPAERDFFPDWAELAPAVVGAFRAAVGKDSATARAAELIAELSARSLEFAELWARHDVDAVPTVPTVVVHPVVGAVSLNREKLTSPEGLVVVIYHPVGDDDRELLTRLIAPGSPRSAPR